MLRTDYEKIAIHFGGHELHLRASGCCYWPRRKTLIVSDLHLEKGSYFAARGQPIPRTDTRSTLEKLKHELTALAPETVVCLGDNIHDARGFSRMDADDLSVLHSLCTSVTNWLWVLGNHDSLQGETPDFIQGTEHTEVMLDNLCLTHDLRPNTPWQIIGHYHPKVQIKKQGIKLSGRCFMLTESKLLMPAFGSYTGGLDSSSQVYKEFLEGIPHEFLIHKERIFRVR